MWYLGNMQPNQRVRLTALTSGAAVERVKSARPTWRRSCASYPPPRDPNVLVGIATADDAGVYRLDDDTALVQTVDFFTPVVDDPYDFGCIAAANALSDIYAMGATPLTALNIVAFPMESLGGEVLTQILAGGAAAAREAGVAIIGGHTIEDDEPKYGLAVTGTVHPKRIVTNAGAKPGDLLYLTKPIGTGILSSALKKDAIDEHAMAPAIASMKKLNAGAALAMVRVGVNAATDITGFGLLGHAGEMARASHVRLRIIAGHVAAVFPKYGSRRSRRHTRRGHSQQRTRTFRIHTQFAKSVPDSDAHLAFRRTNVGRPSDCGPARASPSPRRRTARK